MGEADGEVEFNVEELIKKINDDENGPTTMAIKVHNALAEKGISNWEAYCFAVEYLGAMTAIFPHTKEAAQALIRYTYLTHYLRFVDVEWLARTSVSAVDTTTGPSISSSITSKE